MSRWVREIIADIKTFSEKIDAVQPAMISKIPTICIHPIIKNRDIKKNIIFQSIFAKLSEICSLLNILIRIAPKEEITHALIGNKNPITMAPK